MVQVATITAKRQLTIPSVIFKKARLRERQKVLVEEKGGVIQIQPSVNRVLELSGSVKLPKRFHGKNAKEIIEIARSEYFLKKYKLPRVKSPRF